MTSFSENAAASARTTSFAQRWTPVFLFLLCASWTAFADDICHFRPAKVSPDEARILTLAGVTEFRCDYEVPAEMLKSDLHYNGTDKYHGFDLYVEIYSGTTCKARYAFGFDWGDPNDPMKGSISLGWNSDKHELRNAVDNGVWAWPFTSTITLKNYSSLACTFFENSPPEKRHSQVIGAPDFVLYPVCGMYAGMDRKYVSVTDVPSFLQMAEKANVSAIIIYLFKSSGGSAPLQFNPAP